jgi:hypothetical protein
MKMTPSTHDLSIDVRAALAACPGDGIPRLVLTRVLGLLEQKRLVAADVEPAPAPPPIAPPEFMFGKTVSKKERRLVEDYVTALYWRSEVAEKLAPHILSVAFAHGLDGLVAAEITLDVFTGAARVCGSDIAKRRIVRDLKGTFREVVEAAALGALRHAVKHWLEGDKSAGIATVPP